MWPTAEPASVSLMPMQNRPSPLAAIGSRLAHGVPRGLGEFLGFVALAGHRRQ